MVDKTKILNSIPNPLKTTAASLWGYYLRWWRYGSETESLIDDAIARERWSDSQWQIWRENRLAYVLQRAAEKVPFYREYWAGRRRHGDHSDWQQLKNWPIMTKEELRLHPKAFIAEDCDPRKMFVDHTGGTTGTPLNIYLSRETIHHWYAMYEARIRKWHGVSIKEPWAILGGQLVVPIGQRKPPYWVHNTALNQLYLSTFHISSQNALSYARILMRYKPSHLIVYPSSAAVLSQTILDQNLEVPFPKVIFSNAEMLWEGQREIISSTFKCPVRNTYGMGEIVLAASECEAGELHFWSDSGVLEICDEDGGPMFDNKVGQIVATGLINPDMPLVRYVVGDRGKVNQPSKCICGRNLPIMQPIEGRLSDLITTQDGRKIFWMNPIFYGLPIQEAQIIQEALNHIHVKVVPSKGFANADLQDIIYRVKKRVGEEVSITVESVNDIPRAKNGKFKAVISNIK